MTGTFLAKFELLITVTTIRFFAAVAAIPVAAWDVVLPRAQTYSVSIVRCSPFELLVSNNSCNRAAAYARVSLKHTNVIVADTITLELFDGTLWCHVRRIPACALETVFILVHVASLATTVTAVPATATVVVI